jgi:hypothetical protein
MLINRTCICSTTRLTWRLATAPSSRIRSSITHLHRSAKLTYHATRVLGHLLSPYSNKRGGVARRTINGMSVVNCLTLYRSRTSRRARAS